MTDSAPREVVIELDALGRGSIAIDGEPLEYVTGVKVEVDPGQLTKVWVQIFARKLTVRAPAEIVIGETGSEFFAPDGN